MKREDLSKSILENARFSFSHSGGNGGQNVNKTNTKVFVFVPISALNLSEDEKCSLRKKLGGMTNAKDELFLSSEEEREQGRNRANAIARLEEKIARTLVKKKKRAKTKPTLASKEKRLKAKKIRAETKKFRRGDF